MRGSSASVSTASRLPRRSTSVPWPNSDRDRISSSDIARELDREVQSVAPLTRSNLIGKGMIWSPSHGDTAFTVPMFDEFMQRTMPGDEWRA